MASRRPTCITCEEDGTGSARFEHAQILDLVGEHCCAEIGRTLGRRVELLGVSFVDALGRDVHGPIPNGVALVGFRLATRPCPGGEPCLKLEENDE